MPPQFFLTTLCAVDSFACSCQRGMQLSTRVASRTMQCKVRRIGQLVNGSCCCCGGMRCLHLELQLGQQVVNGACEANRRQSGRNGCCRHGQPAATVASRSADGQGLAALFTTYVAGCGAAWRLVMRCVCNASADHAGPGQRRCNAYCRLDRGLPILRAQLLLQLSRLAAGPAPGWHDGLTMCAAGPSHRLQVVLRAPLTGRLFVADAAISVQYDVRHMPHTK